MATSFSALKKGRSTAFEALSSQLQKLNTPQNRDETYWKPTLDKAGNGFAVIRFLPAPEEEDLNFVQTWNHAFQAKGGWYIENCLSTLGKDDPVNEFNTKLWASSDNDKGPERTQVRNQARKLNYHSNIYVVSDPAAPENNGKVFRFKYGKKVFVRVNDAMFPPFPDKQPFNPFDLWEGADFKLRVRKVDGYPNYDSSEWGTNGPISDAAGKPLTEAQMEAVYNSMYSLAEIRDPKNFKSYDVLKARLYKVLGLDGKGAEDHPADDEVSLSAPIKSAPARSAPKKAMEIDDEIPFSGDGDEEEGTLDFFKRMVSDD